MKSDFLKLFGVVSSLITSVRGNAGVFTYYDDEFTAPGSSNTLQVGPASWKNLLIQNNQCGGIGQKTGYGQSPVVIPRQAANQCDTNLSGYAFKPGTCTFEQLHFRIVTNGVIVGPWFDSGCTLGQMKIPGSDSWFNALQFHIHASSEHSVDGKYYPAELHIVHQEENHKSFAVFGVFIDKYELGDAGIASGQNSIFEHYLQGWEAVRTQTDQLCAAIPEGTGQFSPNRLFTSKQQLLQCPAVGSSVSPDDIDNFVWTDEVVFNPQTATTLITNLPQLNIPDFPSGPAPDLYTLFTNQNSGIYTYRGGLTTPPCTEIVHWNLLDTPMFISSDQLDRLYEIILCFTERSTCRHATVASIFGTTNRPPQPLLGRKITHRCSDGPPPADSIAIADPIPPVHKAFKQAQFLRPWLAVLYPWFIMILGVVTYYLLSRFVHALPYTALMFIFGTFMGVGITALKNTDQLSISTAMWSNINSELLLLVFLPGLIFRDAFCLNVYLLKDALAQCLIMAFPMVLAGTSLLALVGYYILPYGWSFSLSMTFGAILSATDPVAVSALLNEVGAPPRLKMHISGESLLNDGSAMVFYTIFASLFLFEQGIPGLGNDIDVGTGFRLFFKMSLGAVAIGLAFGLGLVRLLFLFNRRFQPEESVVQVTSTISIAYLCYYVAEAVCQTSGVLAVVTCGVVTKAFGYNMINDPTMMEKFWVLVEHMLNTLLFALGGVVWGTVISNKSSFRSEEFTEQDWAYLVLVYILMMAVRFFLLAAAYPIIGRIGLRSSWKEVVFISFGGLRGAVGIALAISLDNELRRDTVFGDPRRGFTSQLFGLTGGVALLTLLINGTLCGPLLRKLGLADSTETREKIVIQYRHHAKEHVMDKLMQKLSDSRFENVDFVKIQSHVPSLRKITIDDIKAAVKRYKANTPVHEYKEPNLTTFKSIVDETPLKEISSLARVSSAAKLKGLVMRTTLSNVALESLDKDEDESAAEDKLVELRKIFVELLRYAYKRQIECGEVEVRKGFVVFTLQNSLEYTCDAIVEGKPICDWDMLQKISSPWTNRTRDALNTPVKEELHRMSSIISLAESDLVSEEKKKTASDVERAVAYIEAHQTAQKMFKEDFTRNRFLSIAERQILEESCAQLSKAEDFLQSIIPSELENIMSHLLCTILLNRTALFIGNLISQGLLKEQEGEDFIRELVEHELQKVGDCAGKHCNKSKRKISGSINSSHGSGIPIAIKEALVGKSDTFSIREDNEDNDSSDNNSMNGITF